MIFILIYTGPQIPSYDDIIRLFKSIEGDYSKVVNVCLHSGPRAEKISLLPYYNSFIDAYNKKTGFNYLISRYDVGNTITFAHISFLGKTPSSLDRVLLNTPVTHTDKGKKRQYIIPDSKVVRRLVEEEGPLHGFRDQGLYRIIETPTSRVTPRTLNLVPEDTREFKALLAATLQGK